MNIKILGGAFIVLLALVVLVKCWPENHAPELKIGGIGWNNLGDTPVNLIELSVLGRTILLEKDGDNWILDNPRGAFGDRTKINQVIRSFSKDITSVLSSPVSPENESAFGLDPGNSIRVCLKNRGQVLIDLEIGAFKKDEDGGDTFVRIPGQNRAWRIVDRNLRQAFSEFSFRSSQVLPFSKDPVAKIQLKPGASRVTGDDIVLEKVDSQWQIMAPKGHRGGDIDEYVNHLVSLRAVKWVDEVPIEFTGDLATINIELNDGAMWSITTSEIEDGFAWIIVKDPSNHAPSIAKISEHSARSINKSLAELKDKKVFPWDSQQIFSISLDMGDGGGQKWTYQRQGNAFTAKFPRAASLNQDEVEELFQTIARLKAERMIAIVDSPVNPPSGFSKTLTVTPFNGPKSVLYLGPQDDQGNVWAWRSLDEDVMTLARWVTDRIEKTRH